MAKKGFQTHNFWRQWDIYMRRNILKKKKRKLQELHTKLGIRIYEVKSERFRRKRNQPRRSSSRSRIALKKWWLFHTRSAVNLTISFSGRLSWFLIDLLNLDFSWGCLPLREKNHCQLHSQVWKLQIYPSSTTAIT